MYLWGHTNKNDCYLNGNFSDVLCFKGLDCTILREKIACRTAEEKQDSNLWIR